MDDIIGQLLRAGLLANLGEDQERADRLRAASKHLRAGFLSDARADIPSALLAAVDEDGPRDVPVLRAARAAIVDKWEMFENAYVQRDPSSILRAVTLDAVVAATEADPQVAAAVWYTLRDVAPVVSAGRWAQPITGFRNDLDAKVSQRINETWEPTARGWLLRMSSVSAAVKTGPVRVAGIAKFRTSIEQHGVDRAVSENLSDLLESLLAAVTQHTQGAPTPQRPSASRTSCTRSASGCVMSWPPTRACSWRSRAATPCCGGGLVVVATGWELGITRRRILPRR